MSYHDDAEAVQWLQDYWDYVQMVEHGNEPSLNEIGGWDGLAQAFTGEDVFNQIVRYLSDDVNANDPNSDAGQLLSRLKQLKGKYMGMNKMKKMSFTERVCQYIKNNYDIPEKMEFYIGAEEYDFEDWVDAYVEEFNNNVIEPYGDDSDESDVKVVGDEILNVMTSTYNVGRHVYTLNYEEFEDDDDFEASSKKSKSVKKARMVLEYGWDEKGDDAKEIEFTVPESIQYNSVTYPAEIDTVDDNYCAYNIKDSVPGDKDAQIGVSVWASDGLVYVGAIHPNGNRIGRHSAYFTYYEYADENDIARNPHIVEDMVQQAVASLPTDDYSASTKKSKRMAKSHLIYVCPYCNHKEIDDGSLEYDEDDEDYARCPKCGQWMEADHYESGAWATKKSQDIHSMIADIRKSNNSLVKNRVDLSVNKYRNLQSVGPDYPLDVDRIVREMLDIIIQSRESNGDFALDEYGAYEEWEKRNYEIVAYDEDGDETYNEEIYDKLEDAFIDYRNRMKDELMDKIYDLEYNDLISIAGREVYVKSTNGNDSYEGCKIWCGPEKDDERGWYFDASDFEEVISRSESGDNIWNHSW